MAVAPEQVMPSLLVVPEVSATEILGVGSGRTVIVVLTTSVQPLLVTVTVTLIVKLPPN